MTARLGAAGEERGAERSLDGSRVDADRPQSRAPARAPGNSTLVITGAPQAPHPLSRAGRAAHDIAGVNGADFS